MADNQAAEPFVANIVVAHLCPPRITFNAWMARVADAGKAASR